MSIQNSELTEGQEFTEQDIATRKVERKKADNHFDIYANDAQLVISYYDFQLSFGEILEASKEKLVTEDALTVKMSPQLALRIRDILIEQVDSYEDIHGAIPKPNSGVKAGKS